MITLSKIQEVISLDGFTYLHAVVWVVEAMNMLDRGGKGRCRKIAAVLFCDIQAILSIINN